MSLDLFNMHVYVSLYFPQKWYPDAYFVTFKNILLYLGNEYFSLFLFFNFKEKLKSNDPNWVWTSHFSYNKFSRNSQRKRGEQNKQAVLTIIVLWVIPASALCDYQKPEIF